MNEVKFMGDTYTKKGEWMYKNGVKSSRINELVVKVDKIEALLVDNKIYYDGEWFIS